MTDAQLRRRCWWRTRSAGWRLVARSLDALAARAWCNGCTRAFQALGDGFDSRRPLSRPLSETALRAPRRRAVRRLWQLAHTTSHFAISSKIALPLVAMQRLANGKRFVPQVVELQHDRVTLATVHAWVCLEVVDQVDGPFS